FVEDELPIERLPTRAVLPPPPDWATLYFGQGKKDKLNKVDLVGFLLQKGRLAKEDLGRIEVKDHHAFAAVRRARVDGLLRLVRDERIKGRRVKLELAK
ncbi:MAG: DbpA RNA binding domain-containing protein, partial [Planctomycetes bacterium]|nr:DbpA RNA binding domain-containing protein [Planctomycetota bacterium]